MGPFPIYLKAAKNPKREFIDWYSAKPFQIVQVNALPLLLWLKFMILANL
jgi:hypothetical protein